MSGLLATSQLRNALAPRISAACPLTAEMFVIVAAAPTAWCTADLRLDAPTTAVLQQTPAAFVQLRSISVRSDAHAAPIDMAALVAMPASLNQRTLREIEFGPEIAVTDDFMLRGLASVTARLETLIIGDGAAVTDAGLASLRDTPMIATLRKFSLIGSDSITDAAVAALLGPASELRSLTLRWCTQLSGAFLTQLHEHCHDSLTEIDLCDCDSIDNAGAAALCTFRGLTELGLSETAELSVLPLELLPLLRAVKGWFLRGSGGLTTLDLVALSNVTSVGDHFLSYCRSLTTLDLTALSNLTSVGRCFLDGCGGLTTLDLAPLANATSVRSCFLRGCSGLTTLDLSRHTNVTSIDDDFLCECSSLTTLDLSRLTNVASVGGAFLCACSRLRTLRLSATLLEHGSVLDKHKQLHARSDPAALSAAAQKYASAAAF